MADTQHPVTPKSSEEAGYELSDSGLSAALFFAAILAVLLVTSIFATMLLLNYFQSGVQSDQEQTELYSNIDTEQLPIGVRLQVDPVRDWTEAKEADELLLHNSDVQEGRISIEEAIDRILEQGLPSREE